MSISHGIWQFEKIQSFSFHFSETNLKEKIDLIIYEMVEIKCIQSIINWEDVGKKQG